MNDVVVEYRSAAAGDLDELLVLLRAARLPTEGVADMVPNTVVAVSGGSVLGAAGVELYGNQALLRSVVVRNEWRARGIGRELVHRALEQAVDLGATHIYLLTEGAADYFEAYGFGRVNRDDVQGPVVASAEFSHLCPASAVTMMLDLVGRTKDGGGGARGDAAKH